MAPKRKSVCNFFKITTTFTVQIAICWPCYRVLFRPDSPRPGPIFGGPRGRNPQIKTTISSTPKFGGFWRAYPTLRTPVPTPPSRAHPKDDARSKQLPQITIAHQFSSIFSDGHRFFINFIDFLRRSSIFHEFSLISIDFHRFPAEIPASSFISS